MLPRVNVIRADHADYLLFSTRDVVSAAVHDRGAWDAPLLAISKMFYADLQAPLIIDIGAEDSHILIPAIDYEKSANIDGFSLDQQWNDLPRGVEVNSNLRPTEVPLARLDSLTFPGTPALIKIDVEGLELQVLKGARGFLEEHHFPPLLLEAWREDWFKEERRALLEYLGALGYGYFEIQDELIAHHPAFPRQIKSEVDANLNLYMTRTRWSAYLQKALDGRVKAQSRRCPVSPWQARFAHKPISL